MVARCGQNARLERRRYELVNVSHLSLKSRGKPQRPRATTEHSARTNCDPHEWPLTRYARLGVGINRTNMRVAPCTRQRVMNFRSSSKQDGFSIRRYLAIVSGWTNRHDASEHRWQGRRSFLRAGRLRWPCRYGATSIRTGRVLGHTSVRSARAMLQGVHRRQGVRELVHQSEVRVPQGSRVRVQCGRDLRLAAATAPSSPHTSHPDPP